MYDDKSRKDLERLAGLYKDKGHSKYVNQHKYMWIKFLAGGWVHTIDQVLNIVFPCCIILNLKCTNNLLSERRF